MERYGCRTRHSSENLSLESKESNRNQSNKGKMRQGKKQSCDGLAQLPFRSDFVSSTSLKNNLLKISLNGATANSFNLIKQKNRQQREPKGPTGQREWKLTVHFSSTLKWKPFEIYATGNRRKYQRTLVPFPSAQLIKTKSKYNFVRNKYHNFRKTQILETKKYKDKERISMKYISFASYVYGVGNKRGL